MSNPRRVVVTGIGAVTPAGIGETDLWAGMLAGKSGIRHITAFDLADYKARNGGEVDNALLTPALQANGINTGDRTVDMGMLAAAQALKQAGIAVDQDNIEPRNTATIVGTGIGSSHSLYDAFMSFSEKGVRGLRPSSVPRCMANAVSSRISMKFKLTGPNYAVISACTSSTNAVGLGYRMIRDSYCDEALCVGADAPFDPFVYAGWNNMGVMSVNPDPLKSSRPFDNERDGCVLGEGAGALMLESMEKAAARHARIRGEIVGYGESSDAEHITRPSAEGQARAMRAALSSAGLQPADIGSINAHGTATRANDETESMSIRMIAGEAADNIPVASNKSIFGHLLGAAGIVESIVTLLGLEQGRLPPNLNLDNPDPKCNLCFVGSQAAQIESPLAMKNSFGFGGNNAVLILRRWNDAT